MCVLFIFETPGCTPRTWWRKLKIKVQGEKKRMMEIGSGVEAY